MDDNIAKLSTMSPENLDLFVYDLINNWPVHAGVNVIHDGIDFAELTRWYLWGKVARVIRKKLAPEEFEIEESTVIHKDNYLNILEDLPQNAAAPLKNKIKTQILSLQKWINDTRHDRKISNDIKHILDANTVVFVPYHSQRLEKEVSSLIEAKIRIIINGPLKYKGYDGSYLMPYPQKIKKPDIQFGKYLYNGILEGLQKQGIELLHYDASLLSEQISKEMEHVKLVEAQLKAYSPDAILLHGDNHAPYQTYALVAQRDGIPTITFQHGLDCERYYLDETYVTAIALWSEKRLNSYRKNSKRQPNFMQITGNPDYDDLKLPESIELLGNYWLWITRPHSSHYCYNPSRFPKEGLDILDVLLEALQESPSSRLIIKPHPSDLITMYDTHVACSKVSNRVEISQINVKELLPNASIVITEDSTGGLEAMFYGKVIVHAHFAKTPSVLPMVEYEAALPGFTPTLLREAIKRSSTLSPMEIKAMIVGQRAFIKDYAGELTGNAGIRRSAFIMDCVTCKKKS